MDSAPRIAPLPPGARRCRWSVMIPVYNCSRYLTEALKSVLHQDLGPEEMQIAVVDNCSSDDPEAVVKRLGDGRVEFFRQNANIGMVGNFNSCIEHARGSLVHILHADDYVEEGFYRRLDALERDNPDAGLLAARSHIVDESGQKRGTSPRASFLESLTREPGDLLYRNYFFAPGVVVKRDFYEKFGGYLPTLSFVPDWEMWLRAISRAGGVALSEPLACYRQHHNNLTSAFIKKAENVLDPLRLGEITARQFQAFDSAAFRASYAMTARAQCTSLLRSGDLMGAWCNARALFAALDCPAGIYLIKKAVSRFNKRIREC